MQEGNKCFSNLNLRKTRSSKSRKFLKCINGQLLQNILEVTGEDVVWSGRINGVFQNASLWCESYVPLRNSNSILDSVKGRKEITQQITYTTGKVFARKSNAKFIDTMLQMNQTVGEDIDQPSAFQNR